jgi:hypothetical protein
MRRFATMLVAMAACACAGGTDHPHEQHPSADKKHVWMSTFIQQFAVPAEDSHVNAQRLYEFNQRCDAHPVRFSSSQILLPGQNLTNALVS